MELERHLIALWVIIMLCIAIGLLTHDSDSKFTRLQHTGFTLLYGIACSVFIDIVYWGIRLIHYLFH